MYKIYTPKHINLLIIKQRPLNKLHIILHVHMYYIFFKCQQWTHSNLLAINDEISITWLISDKSTHSVFLLVNCLVWTRRWLGNKPHCFHKSVGKMTKTHEKDTLKKWFITILTFLCLSKYCFGFTTQLYWLVTTTVLYVFGIYALCSKSLLLPPPPPFRNAVFGEDICNGFAINRFISINNPHWRSTLVN